MFTRLFLFLSFIAVLTIACNNRAGLEEATTISADIKNNYAPDKRVAMWNIAMSPSGKQILLKGQTNLPAAKADFIKQLTAKEITIIDSIEVLPNENLGAKTYGIVNVSVCNIRSKNGHSQELATQALLGTPIKVLQQKDNWFLIQTPDKYIAWLDHGGFVQVNEATYKEWISAPKVLYTSDFGFSYESPNLQAQKITDLVAGNILKSIGQEKGFIKVQYPDGRTAFVPEKTVVNYDTWLASRNPDATNILATAQEYLGRPYLWGGTSGKGMDCSGFTKTVFYLNGIQLARDASQQVHTGNLIETDETLKNVVPGDLLFFGRKATTEKKERITHVGIYMGKGEFIHSSGDAGVKIESLIAGAPNFNKKRLATFVKAKRMVTSLGRNGVDLLAELPAYNPSEL
ncbi:MAG: NlpC/P60 family protein [Saprospiraceae bacterium]